MRCPASRASSKKEWLKQRFKEGLVFCRSTERGKCFIEYIPAENAWVPIQADGYFYIDCLWVSGLAERARIFQRSAGRVHPGRKGAGTKGAVHSLVEGRKREFLSDPKYLAYKGICRCRYIGMQDQFDVPAACTGCRAAEVQGLCQAPCGGRERLCPLLYRPVPVYLLLGAACGRSRESVPRASEGHPRHQQGAGTERTRPGDDLRAVQGRQVP